MGRIRKDFLGRLPGSRNFGLQGTVSWNFVCGLFLKFVSRNLIRGTALYLDFKIRGFPSIFRSLDPRIRELITDLDHDMSQESNFAWRMVFDGF